MKKKSNPGTKPLVKSTNRFPVVGVGASAGGLDAFKKLLKAIPENSGMAFVLVQHLSPGHESILPELLQKVTKIPVLQITNDIKIEPNHIYIIPSSKVLTATDNVLHLTPNTLKSKHPLHLIDHFFTTLAQVYQDHAIGVVLSGTASDGTAGLKAIKKQGGTTFAQDEESAAYEGMPQSAAKAGAVDFILPPEEIPQKISELLTHTFKRNGNGQNNGQAKEDVFRQILSLLRVRTGTDFTYYKQSTIHRRILRRAALSKHEKPADYLLLLRQNKTEQDSLYQDLLIPVTEFFRDPKSFENLNKVVFPQITKNKINSDPIRIWVAGCSTGEEAYSIAISLHEYLHDKPVKVQIFASDISEAAIVKARQGIYTKEQLQAVTPHQLQNYFIKTEGKYQVKKHIRDICIFAMHDFLKDPPFGNLDLISCRNVLIYMQSYLQKKALTTFHYALKHGGFLLLGKSEAVSNVSNLFAQAVKSDKLFSRKDAQAKFMITASRRGEQDLSDINAGRKTKIMHTDFQKAADEIVLNKYTPAGVIVNEAMDIVHFRGATARYLEQAGGAPSHNLLKMAKHGLSFELRNILHKAKKLKAPAIKENIPVRTDGGKHAISIEAIPLPDIEDPHYLILFHESELSPSPSKSSRSKKDKKDSRIKQLEDELAQNREDMHSITQEQEAANEELQSANEELLSSSEELQSLNEELETSKEELQSTNEELTVLNNELNSLNQQVTEERNFSNSIITNLREPILILDKNLRIKICNANFYKTFQVNQAETEGRLIYDLGDKDWDIPVLRNLLEKILPEKSNFTDFEVSHHFPNIGLRTMQLSAYEILDAGHERLILLSIKDITELKRITLALEVKNIALEDSNKELEAFNYVSSHDLQEPLRSIRTFTGLLLQKESENLSDTGKEYFQYIQVAARRMQTLIEDLLAFSRLSTAERKFQKINLTPIVQEAQKDFTLAIVEKQATIEVGNMCEVKIIPFQFRQLIHNLISNSLKFSKPDMPPHIIIQSEIIKDLSQVSVRRMGGARYKGPYCHLTFADNGIGFDPKFKDRIFQLFQKLHTKDKYSGTGIGLAIVKKIVDNHNGIITASSELGKGARFDIYIPASAS